MLQYAILPFKRYVDFQGRSRRLEYWSFTLFNAVVATVLIGLAFALEPTGDEATLETSLENVVAANAGSLIFLSLFAIYFLAILVPSIAVAVRRLHDRNLSGWWYLAFVVASLLPLLGFIASIAFIIFMALPDTNGANRFGPNPKSSGNAGVFA